MATPESSPALDQIKTGPTPQADGAIIPEINPHIGKTCFVAPIDLQEAVAVTILETNPNAFMAKRNAAFTIAEDIEEFAMNDYPLVLDEDSKISMGRDARRFTKKRIDGVDPFNTDIKH